LRFQGVEIGKGEVAKTFAVLGHVKPSPNRAKKHILLEVADDGFGGFFGLRFEFTKTVAEMFDIEVRQVVRVGGIGVVGEPSYFEFAEDNCGHKYSIPGGGNLLTEPCRFEGADDPGRDGGELLIEVESRLGFREVGRGIELEHFAVGGDEVQRLQSIDGSRFEHTIDTQVGGSARAALIVGFEIRIDRKFGEALRGLVVVELEADGLSAGPFLRSGGEVGTECGGG